jgi:hypothetical protein
VWLVFDHQFDRLKQRLFDITLAACGASPAAVGQADSAALTLAALERRQRREGDKRQQREAGGGGVSSWMSVAAALRLTKALLFPSPGEAKGIKLARCDAAARVRAKQQLHGQAACAPGDIHRGKDNACAAGSPCLYPIA